ncbi:FtsK/SpoIIIE domain-containing protein [Luteococcus sp. Sow4_B9]|uniref:FtsK/SpoIIIE domain-containing protein n=1 Tax=Luteococcus sp. Sow4_B9 TaxID=3438792 RepID=UPI003F96B358
MSDLAFRVGVTETGSALVIDLGMAAHIACQGSTRSGKSVLSYSILANAARLPEVQVWGCDPTGVLLKPFAETAPERFVLGTKDPAKFADLAESLVAEMDRRIEEEIYAKDLDKIDDFSADLPLMLLVLEETPGIFDSMASVDSQLKPAERSKPRFDRAYSRLVSEGAKAGVRVLLIAQRMDTEVIGGRQRSQFATAITLRVPDSTAVRMLHHDVPEDVAAMIPRAKPGVGICETPGNLVRFRGYNLDYKTYLDLVRKGLSRHNTTKGVPNYV